MEQVFTSEIGPHRTLVWGRQWVMSLHITSSAGMSLSADPGQPSEQREFGTVLQSVCIQMWIGKL